MTTKMIFTAITIRITPFKHRWVYYQYLNSVRAVNFHICETLMFVCHSCMMELFLSNIMKSQINDLLTFVMKDN